MKRCERQKLGGNAELPSPLSSWNEQDEFEKIRYLTGYVK